MKYFESLRKDGFLVFREVLPNRIFFTELYDVYDKLLSILDDSSKRNLYENSIEWLSLGDNADYFCGVPCAFKERDGLNGRPLKNYIQWSLEYSNSVWYHLNDRALDTHLNELSNKLNKLESICSPIFQDAIKDIAVHYPMFRNNFQDGRPLPIIFKLLRYEQFGDNFATAPHYDKSGLTLLLDADDQNPSWRIGYGQNCKLSEMYAPFDYPKNPMDKNHTILFSGICLSRMGVDIEPTPHFVMPIKGMKFRHSLIAFLLVPGFENLSSIDITPKYIHDKLPNYK